MALAPPWTDAPLGFVLDGALLSTRIPDTRTLVTTLLIPEDDPRGGLYTVLAMCDDDSAWPFVRSILEQGSTITLALLDSIADRLFESHIGVPRWVAQRVWQQAYGSWTLVDGEMQLRGLDVLTMPMSRATTAVYALIRSWHTGDDDQLKRWTRKIETPPLREIRRYKRENVALESTSTDTMAERMAKMKRSNAPERPSRGATITMPSSDTLTPDTNDPRGLPPH
ncbi:hypothetical protein J1770_gp28 [Gordonia phage EMoore]|uniref:Tail assembly chaperone n=1 Tax=Gordonia phage EMoore TaxID=2656534 RepID=A0A649VUE3_9CAUD|nr:hypothetical protein J1770_gp28 [Gordonia phage EMoore]QGJ95814.1 hypothetical protein SEA_EMOORE_28 [Gordonia phage EMoore]